MIDEKGRLFGKINIVDLLIVLVLIAAIAFVGIKVFGSNDTTPDAEDMIFVLNCEATPTYVASRLKEGASVYILDSKMTIGTVESFEIYPFYNYTDDYELSVMRESSYYEGVRIKVRCQGYISERGIVINDTVFGVGHSMTIFCDDAKLFVRVEDYERAE